MIGRPVFAEFGRKLFLISAAAIAPRFGAAQPAPDTSGGRSKILPAIEIPVFLTLLNVYDRYAYPNLYEDGTKVYAVTFNSAWDHLRRETWVHDQDPFNVNQFGHPYEGATMYGLARSSGQGFWKSLVYSDAGSFAWEIAGETDPPSINDLITTGQAGTLLGETLYRLSDLVLKDNPGKNHFWHDLLADVLSPSVR